MNDQSLCIFVQSELPFRMLCRKYGATAAYTPMLHARLFSEGSKYREEHFTTCPEDRPLFVQFCANDPDVLVSAAEYVEEAADYIDLNFGCPQRIARKGHYGAFLMDDLPCVESLVRALHKVRFRSTATTLMHPNTGVVMPLLCTA
jgi:tRNA-dihydrouridine synthase 1